MNSQVIDKIKEILGLPAEEVNLNSEDLAPVPGAPADTTAPTAPADTTAPTDTTTTPDKTPAELQLEIEELDLKIQDLNSRLTIIESMFMQSQQDQEKLASIVEVLKNLPSGEPVAKKETAEGSFKSNKTSKNENKFYNLGKIMKNNK